MKDIGMHYSHRKIYVQDLLLFTENYTQVMFEGPTLFVCIVGVTALWHILLTWINFDPSMDK